MRFCRECGTIIATVVVTLGLTGCAAFGGNQIDMEEITEVEVSGFDGAGNLDISVDKDEIRWAMEDEEVPDDVQDSLLSSIEVSASEDKNLSNEQEVTISLKYNERAAKRAKIKFKNEEWTYTVEGLDEAEAFDPFDYVTVNFTGNSPAVMVDVNPQSTSGKGTLNFTADKVSGLANGDKITVTCDIDEEKWATKGYKITQTSKEYTVEGMPTIVTSVKDIKDDDLTNMKEAAEELIQPYIDETLEYGFDTTGLKYIGSMVLSKKELRGNSGNNEVILMYSFTVSGGKENFEETTGYLPIRFTDVTLSTDVSLSYGDVREAYSTAGGYKMYNNNFNALRGYDDASIMYNELIGNKTNNYNVDMEDKLSELFN